MDFGKCTNCQTLQKSLERNCLTCGSDLGFPNVRFAKHEVEHEAFTKRYDDALLDSEKNALDDAYIEVEELIEKNSFVIIAIPSDIAISLVNNDHILYQNSEQLIDQNKIRRPGYENDRIRAIVGASLFSSMAKDIVYAALTLNDQEAASNYGDVFFVLKNIAIENRTTFTEMNSYDLFDKFGARDIPHGYRAIWEERGKLASLKFHGNQDLNNIQNVTYDDVQPILLRSGKNGRKGDDYIEAHIYGPFNINSVDKITHSPGIKGKALTLARMAIKAFNA